MDDAERRMVFRKKKFKKWQVVLSSLFLVATVFATFGLMIPMQMAHASQDFTVTRNHSCTQSGNNPCWQGRSWTTTRIAPHMSDTNVRASAIWRFTPNNSNLNAVNIANTGNITGNFSVTADTGTRTNTSFINGSHHNAGDGGR